MLLDPSQTVVSGTNPVQVDTGLPNQSPCSSGCTGSNHDTDQATSYSTGSINSSTGQVSGIHGVVVVYVKAGKLYMVNLLSGASHTPVQVSNLTNLCGLDAKSSQQLADYSNPTNSWVLVGQPGPDNTCYTSDDTEVAVQLSMSSTTTPPSVTGLSGAIAQHNASGAITGFFDGEGTSGITLVLRNASFGSPTTVATVSSGGQVGVFQAGLQTIYFCGPLTSSSPQLFQATATGLSSPLFTFVNGDPHSAFKHSASDANNLYFADGNVIHSIARSGGTVNTLTTLASGLTVNSSNIALTATRLVISASNTSGGGGIFSVPNNASSATATVLAQDVTGTNFTNVFVESVDPAGLVYINQTTGSSGGVSNTAISIHDDGTGASTIQGQWLGEADSTTIPNVNAQLQTAPSVVLRESYSVNGTGTASISSYNSSTGLFIATLGSIANVNNPSTFGFGFAPYLGIISNVQYSTTSKNDAYIANVTSTNSLAAVSTNNASSGDNNSGNNTYVGE